MYFLQFLKTTNLFDFVKISQYIDILFRCCQLTEGEQLFKTNDEKEKKIDLRFIYITMFIKCFCT